MGIPTSILSPLFTIDSDSFSPNTELVVLVCSQCSATRHSACLWRCISHLVFGIQPVDTLMFSWHTECHQTLTAKKKTKQRQKKKYKVVWPFPVSKSGVHYVCGSECAHTCECVCRWVPCICESECDCICMHMLREESQQITVSLGGDVSVSRFVTCPGDELISAVLPVVPATRDLSRCETGVSAWLGVFQCSCS